MSVPSLPGAILEHNDRNMADKFNSHPDNNEDNPMVVIGGKLRFVFILCSVECP